MEPALFRLTPQTWMQKTKCAACPSAEQIKGEVGRSYPATWFLSIRSGPTPLFMLSRTFIDLNQL